MSDSSYAAEFETVVGRLMQDAAEDSERADAIESRIAKIAAGFGADPVQDTEDDLVTIERGISKMRADLMAGELHEGVLERELAGAQRDAEHAAAKAIAVVATLQARIAELESAVPVEDDR
jgi:hypothetical protein